MPPKKDKGVMKCSADRCPTCQQFLIFGSIKPYEGHPEGALEEFVALTFPQLCVLSEEETNVLKDDFRPSIKMTSFTVYDKEGHLCPFDMGVIENNSYLYFSGYMKPIYNDSPGIEDGVPAKDIGPINEWWLCSEEGQTTVVGFSTAYAHYYLMQPSASYAPIMQEFNIKLFIGKVVLNFVVNNCHTKNSYPELLEYLRTVESPAAMIKLDEECLLRNAQFICDYLSSLNEPGVVDDKNLILVPCIRDLINLTGVVFFKRKSSLRSERQEVENKLPEWSKATKTPLVERILENIGNQVIECKIKILEHKLCGKCDSCLRPNCGVCTACLTKGKKHVKSSNEKSACITRRCPNIAVQEATYEERELLYNNLTMPSLAVPTKLRDLQPLKFTWGSPVFETENFIIFHEFRVQHEETAEMEICAGDFVILKTADSKQPAAIACVKYLQENKNTKQKLCHIQSFMKASDTILGDAACKNEIFQLEECKDISVFCVQSKITVHMLDVSIISTRNKYGELELINPFPSDNNTTFWCQKSFDQLLFRFLDIPADCKTSSKSDQHYFCGCCKRLEGKKAEHGLLMKPLPHVQQSNKSLIQYAGVKWCGELLLPGLCIFVHTDAFEVANKTPIFGVVASLNPKKRFRDEDELVDQNTFTEFHRKGFEFSTTKEKHDPFRIARIISIFTVKKEKKKSEIHLKVAKFFRHEDTLPSKTADVVDHTLLYWSSDICEIEFKHVQGKCWVKRSNTLDVAPSEWTREGPNRFHYNQAYHSSSRKFHDLPEEALYFGSSIKDKHTSHCLEQPVVPPVWPSISKPLHCLDVFAGCGGFAEGIKQSRVAITKWAVENDEAAATSFKLNHPACTVLMEDGNKLLQNILDGNLSEYHEALPQTGEVEILCGDPPCYGFTGLDQLNFRQYQIYKQSCVVTLLSYCDYYRPKYFVLANPQQFLGYKQMKILHITLSCLLAMGYQCSFGQLNAGSYGVPQITSRAFILAAAPGKILPDLPDPTHTLNVKSTSAEAFFKQMKYTSDESQNYSGPLPAVTVHDAISDLPEICNGAIEQYIKYKKEPETLFQQLARQEHCEILQDHICKKMSPLVFARISQIPTTPGADWRDLPNIILPLSDGTATKKIIYTHKVNLWKKGVCSCASGEECDPMCKQVKTLIPWCLAHTADSHKNWAGLYGRVGWTSVFKTNITNPEPLSKQGCVLHPDQNRVVSVRECARVQGFSDSFKFSGTTIDKYLQIGNTVPPPMAAAIGREILLCISKIENKPTNQ